MSKPSDSSMSLCRTLQHTSIGSEVGVLHPAGDDGNGGGGEEEDGGGEGREGGGKGHWRMAGRWGIRGGVLAGRQGAAWREA